MDEKCGSDNKSRLCTYDQLLSLHGLGPVIVLWRCRNQISRTNQWRAWIHRHHGRDLCVRNKPIHLPPRGMRNIVHCVSRQPLPNGMGNSIQHASWYEAWNELDAINPNDTRNLWLWGPDHGGSLLAYKNHLGTRPSENYKRMINSCVILTSELHFTSFIKMGDGGYGDPVRRWKDGWL